MNRLNNPDLKQDSPPQLWYDELKYTEDKIIGCCILRPRRRHNMTVIDDKNGAIQDYWLAHPDFARDPLVWIDFVCCEFCAHPQPWQQRLGVRGKNTMFSSVSLFSADRIRDDNNDDWNNVWTQWANAGNINLDKYRLPDGQLQVLTVMLDLISIFFDVLLFF